MSVKLPDLPYAFNALEPHIDAKTMEIHHDKHHATYVTKFNEAVAGKPEDNESIEAILGKISSLPMPVRNNGGGHFNHSLFWTILAPNPGATQPSGPLAEAIDASFGSLDAFKAKFAEAATLRFGSGWAWLIVQNGVLKVTSTPNQDNPLMDVAEERVCRSSGWMYGNMPII